VYEYSCKVSIHKVEFHQGKQYLTNLEVLTAPEQSICNEATCSLKKQAGLHTYAVAAREYQRPEYGRILLAGATNASQLRERSHA
jgi:hypothetical protein